MSQLEEIYLISIFVLIIISAIFAAAETSITAASRPKAHRLKNAGNRKAKILEKLLQNREKVISTMLAGNNAVNILASALATSLLIKFFGEAGLIYSTITMTILILIFSEIAPKTLALKAPDSIALFLSPLINFIVKLLFPFTYVAQKIVDTLIKLLSVKSYKKSENSELDEIRDTVAFKAKEGSIFKYDKDLLGGVLDLSDTEISEIMVHRKNIESINADLPISEILKQALTSEYTRLPLWRGNKENIIAILNVRKFLKALYAKKDAIENFDLNLVVSEPWFIPSTNSLRTQLFAFRKKRKRFALVIDEYGLLLGLVTLEDILEEIVGEIKEKNRIQDNITKITENTYQVSGKTLVRDVNKRLDWSIAPLDEAYNLSTFIISHLDRVPDEKEHFVIDDYYFEILKKKNQDLLLIKVRRVKTSPEV